MKFNSYQFLNCEKIEAQNKKLLEIRNKSLAEQKKVLRDERKAILKEKREKSEAEALLSAVKVHYVVQQFTKGLPLTNKVVWHYTE